MVVATAENGMPASAKLQKLGQSHVLQYWDDLKNSEKDVLMKQLSVDVEELCRSFEMTKDRKEEKLDELMTPPEKEVCGSRMSSTPEQIKVLWTAGLKLISEGKVAALVLAGGQGTRLGSSKPKGMFDLSLPSHKTLYQIQAERLLRLQTLAKEQFGSSKPLPWYIMTTEQTTTMTREFFEEKSYFGLSKEQVTFFEQRMIPSFTLDGKFILNSKGSLATAPDGNGGLYNGLVDSGALADMEKRGVAHVHMYCVDNVLCAVADPVFVAFCAEREAECGAKVVKKTNPSEAVGVICRVEGNYRVVEYSEIAETTAALTDGDQLLYSAGNIANHYFSAAFLKRFCDVDRASLPYHVAKKKIPYMDEKGDVVTPKTPNGIKLERFIFDSFPFAKKFALWEVEREDEFAPLKNAEGADSPASCRAALFALHRRWLETAKSPLLTSDPEIEVSPLTSYNGEAL